jgi:hypothetical protein
MKDSQIRTPYSIFSRIVERMLKLLSGRLDSSSRETKGGASSGMLMNMNDIYVAVAAQLTGSQVQFKQYGRKTAWRCSSNMQDIVFACLFVFFCSRTCMHVIP